MNQSTKLVVGIIVVVAIVAIGYFVSKGPSKLLSIKSIKVGTILPLSGSAAVLGEPLKNGLDLALKDKQNISVIHEDSKAVPAEGVSAYQKLISQGVGVVVSAYSGVSVPLTSLATQNKVPLIMTIVAADKVTNEYAYRYYAKPSSYVDPAFYDVISPLKDITNLAILYRNDEFGKSVSDILTRTATKNNKKVLISEAYTVNEIDFSTSLLKLKAQRPQAILFVAGTPSEAVGIVKKASELKIDAVLVEASAALSDPEVQKQTPTTTYYTTSFKFSLPEDNPEFKKQYKDAYNTKPNFAAAFGYDIGNLIARCAESKTEIQTCLDQTKKVDGITGPIINIVNHEINPLMFLMKVN